MKVQGSACAPRVLKHSILLAVAALLTTSTLATAGQIEIRIENAVSEPFGDFPVYCILTNAAPDTQEKERLVRLRTNAKGVGSLQLREHEKVHRLLSADDRYIVAYVDYPDPKKTYGAESKSSPIISAHAFRDLDFMDFEIDAIKTNAVAYLSGVTETLVGMEDGSVPQFLTFRDFHFVVSILSECDPIPFEALEHIVAKEYANAPSAFEYSLIQFLESVRDKYPAGRDANIPLKEFRKALIAKSSYFAVYELGAAGPGKLTVRFGFGLPGDGSGYECVGLFEVKKDAKSHAPEEDVWAMGDLTDTYYLTHFFLEASMIQ